MSDLMTESLNERWEFETAVRATWLNEVDYHKCSKCGAILEEDFYWRCHNYCYHCGARMNEAYIL